MNFNDFCMETEKEVRKRIGEDYNVSVQDVIKNNGVSLRALSIRKKGSGIAPCIYMEKYYENFKRNISGAVEFIIDEYMESMSNIPFQIDYLTEKNYVLERLEGRLINYDKNTDYLNNVPHRKFLDLAIIYTVSISEGCSYVITNELMRICGIKEEEMYKRMILNISSEDKWIFTDIFEVIPKELIFDEARDNNSINLYVLTNKGKQYGAVLMTNEHVMNKIGEKMGNDYYIIPSSVHEVLILKNSLIENIEEKNLMEMVREVNTTEVDIKDVLSDNVYHYVDGKISIV